MNSTSFGERGGSVALVDDGSIRVAWPGALGCTTTGRDLDSSLWAQTGSDKKHVRTPTAKSKLRDAAIVINDLSLRLGLKRID
jgi:hypothetical protein